MSPFSDHEEPWNLITRMQTTNYFTSLYLQSLFSTSQTNLLPYPISTPKPYHCGGRFDGSSPDSILLAASWISFCKTHHFSDGHAVQPAKWTWFNNTRSSNLTFQSYLLALSLKPRRKWVSWEFSRPPLGPDSPSRCLILCRLISETSGWLVATCHAGPQTPNITLD
jgi:hypothetical protein